MSRPTQAFRVARQVSSGGVIVRSSRGNTQVCLIARRADGKLVWGLPKGHVEAGEEPQATAVREVREETGLLGEPLCKLGSIAYWFTVKQERRRYAKTVHFYFLRYLEGHTCAHDDEVEEAAWCSIGEALKRISYKNERRILLKAQRYLTRTGVIAGT